MGSGRCEVWRLIVGVVAVLVAVLAVPAMPAHAQLDDDNRDVTVNYVYAAQIGIGGYEVGGLKVQVFTLPLSHTFDLDPDDTLGDGEAAVAAEGEGADQSGAL